MPAAAGARVPDNVLREIRSDQEVTLTIVLNGSSGLAWFKNALLQKPAKFVSVILSVVFV